MFLAEVSGNNDARWDSRDDRQRLPIHLISDKRGWLHRFRERERVRVVIDAVKANFGCTFERVGRFEQNPHWYAFPNRVAHEAAIKQVADAHQCCFLIDSRKRHELFETISARCLDQAGDFQRQPPASTTGSTTFLVTQ